MLTSPWTRPIRNFTRQLGLNKFLASVFYGNQYEDKFGPTLLEQVKLNDNVWDIGANVGLYTEQFLSKVGEHGIVVACEPAPSCFLNLQAKFAETNRVKLINSAIGEADGSLTMVLEENPLAATHRIVEKHDGENPDTKAIVVSVRSITSIAAEFPELFPNIIKIDVEGHEGSVLDGMKTIMGDRRLRCIGIEVHFSLLEDRGEGKRPQQMQKQLQEQGFEVNWVDPSHIIALRDNN